MYSPLSSIRHARRSLSLISFLARDHGDLTAASRSFSAFPATYGPQQISQDGSKSLANIVRRNISHHVGGLSARSLALSSGIMLFRGNATAPYALRFLSSIGSNAQNDFLSGLRNPMNFVRDIIEVEDRNTTGHPGYTTGKSADFVHIKLMRNNSFVTVTDSKGNKKFGASLGSVPGLKG
ncbi:hypothetical protein L484_026975 [Morus notabilis]|uniref:Uncharacterized protein n=1 Tax=Morus notabilis TaxID=981085 RepID=W9R9C0_9ROSA|nr:probable ribosomal protein S11, mitochondrial [Morus notabilis]EXB63633.1 hypothetical protein L484_026975 [Morus notabilis]